ncbi:hypothetical protein A2917_02790 [Candidatus Nomurabacteria bacterium RIFCSPLOWO2_01_FULL_42_17]|uniref:Uncharacterized protein n=1 Tax=Candidatus Nomurabacteria bacterium RIFCSPLOWO2_01_FULL_42_17 TaxID=1801780 RepID=A0A1F6XN25_9BACT|nr:MAG: hypothetical protein A2917_02790 [Candidatus Nomurabacteria bacterium RIFCSPLOWO2_01_FULL_42_17]
MSTKIKQVSLGRELQRFFQVAQIHRETGRRTFMPACPVDTEWHRRLKNPKRYKGFCRSAVGHEVGHRPVKGEGKIDWTKTYEKLFGKLPEVWFQDTNRILNQQSRLKYLQTGVFHASWDCDPFD